MSIDIVYVVASKLGTIGMGTTAYKALKKLDEDKKLKYKIFCRGYSKNISLGRKNIVSAGYLEYLSLVLRLLEKKMHFKINPFKFVNRKFGDFIYKNLPQCKIYHTWMGISPQAILTAKKNGAILILEGANSHPVISTQIMNSEYSKFHQPENTVDIETVKKDSEIYKKFDYVMCPSDFVYNSFLKQGFKRNQLIKMPYGVDIKKFTPAKKNNKKFRVIFVGSVQLRKGIIYLLKAWEELNLKNAELVIVGRAWPDSIKLIEKYKNNPSIKFVGFDPNPINTLQQSDVFVSPSLEEGSALTTYEAMACGLPLIATFNTGSIVKNGVEGFIIPSANTKQLKEKIKIFYDNPKLTLKMGQSSRKKAEHFTWENYSERLQNKYLELLK